jgi:hypothetical protein
MRTGLGIASVALVVLSACGGGSGGDDASKEAPKATPTLDLLSADQACEQVEMVTAELGGKPGSWPIPIYGEFGTKTAPIAQESVPDIASAVQSMSDRAVEVGEMTLDDDVTTAASVWAAQYQKVSDICARTDSPLARIAY